MANATTSLYYEPGLTIFQFLTDYTGLPLDQVNYLVLQSLALIIAPFYRTHLHYNKVKPFTRHLFGLLLGLFFAYACFGKESIHLLLVSIVCYVLMRIIKNENQLMPRLILLISIIYLSIIHIYRLIYDYGGYSLDITGPLMVIIQKISALAYSVHDGRRKMKEGDSVLNETQKYHSIDRIPSVFEYLSYIFHHQSLLAGPTIFYKDYIEFICGTHITRYNNQKVSKEEKEDGEIKKVVIKKVIESTVYIVVFMKLQSILSIDYLATDQFLYNTNIIYKLIYLDLSTTLTRFKYYHAWILADAICNNSGLGFNGFTENAKPKFDKISNIDVFQFEFAVNFRGGIEAWNKGTNIWLRMVMYDRVKPQLGVICTYALSALWHGFYPGYYLTFATGALCTSAARVFRRYCRSYLIKSETNRMCYDLFTRIVTRMCFSYSTFPFILLKLKQSAIVYLRLYFCIHIICIIIIVFVPKVFKQHKFK